MWLFFIGFLIGGLLGIVVMGLAVLTAQDRRNRNFD